MTWGRGFQRQRSPVHDPYHGWEEMNATTAADQQWQFDERMLGSALDAWMRSQRPTDDTRRALIRIAEFLNSEAAKGLRVITEEA